MSQAKGMNRGLIGRVYEKAAVTVRTQEIRDYADATGDANPRYLDETVEGGIIAPPMFAVRLFRDVLFWAMENPELGVDMLRLLHGEQSFVFHGPIRPGEAIASRCTVDDIVDKKTGQILMLTCTCLRGTEAVASGKAAMFVRAATPPEPSPAPARPKADPPPLPTWTFSQPFTVAADQPDRYAHASLDVNPIHLSDKVARAAGLKGRILQGLCTLAFGQHAVVNAHSPRAPERLRGLSARFSAPVYPGETVTVQGYVMSVQGGVTHVGFRVINGAGQEVIQNGVARVG